MLLAGCYSGLRFLPGDELQSRLEGLQRQLAQAVVERPPHELRKLGYVCQAHEVGIGTLTVP